MGNHDLSNYLRRIMWALCERGAPAQPPTDGVPGTSGGGNG
jgi:hypothetical protein